MSRDHRAEETRRTTNLVVDLEKSPSLEIPCRRADSRASGRNFKLTEHRLAHSLINTVPDGVPEILHWDLCSSRLHLRKSTFSCAEDETPDLEEGPGRTRLWVGASSAKCRFRREKLNPRGACSSLLTDLSNEFVMRIFIHLPRLGGECSPMNAVPKNSPAKVGTSP
jgi:hypothetical protein